MKTRLTLLMVALLSAFAYAATTWQATEETSTAPGTTLVDNELIVAKTVYATTLKGDARTIAGEAFTHYIQVRVDKDPTAENPAGTEKDGSTPILLEAKKDVSLTIYYRRQSTAQTTNPDTGEAISGDFAENDGKDVKVFNQADFTFLTGEMTIVEPTADFKYGYATKKVELAEGSKYVIAARGTTCQFYGITVEAMETGEVTPPVPEMGEAISLAPATGADLAAELAAAQAENPYPASITITLAADGAYTVGETMNVNCPITIKGDFDKPATVDASALEAPVIQLTEDIHLDFTKSASVAQEDGTDKEYTWIDLGDVVLENVEFTGVKRQLFYANKQKVVLNVLAVRNSIIGFDGSAKKSIFDFNGGGNTKKLEVSNSTIWGNPSNEQNGGFFSTQSSQDVTEFNPEFTQEFNITNSTIYNVANGKTVSSLRKNSQKYMKYVVKNNLIISSGKKNQFLVGLNAGQPGKVDNWDVSGNSIQWGSAAEDGTVTFEDILAEEKPAGEATEGIAGIVAFAGDYTTGDFTLGDCPQNEALVGDPRWLAPVIPAIGPAIELAPATGADLAAELAAAQAENPYPASITITLAADGAYTVGETMNVNCPVTIKGDAEKPATIDASAISAPMVQLTEDIHPDFTKTFTIEGEEEPKSYTELGSVVFENVKVNGLKRQLFYANKQKVILDELVVRNSIIGIDGTAKKSIFDFNGGGNTKKLEVSNSTIWANPSNEQNGGFFSTQSSQDVTEFNPEFTQEFNIANSTIYNITNGKTVSTLRKNSQAHMKYVVKDNLIVASGKKNQFLSGLNAGQQGKVGNWDVSGNSFQWENVAEDGTATFEDILSGEKAANAVTEGVEGIVAFAGDYTTGDFTLAQCAQNTAKVGDPRWLVEPKSVFFEITDEEGLATYFNSQYAFIVPEGVQAGVVTTVDNLYSYAKYIYQAGSVVPAGVPVILKGEVKAYAADITAGGGQKPEENLLKGYDAFTEKVTAPEYFYYKLSRSTHNGEKKLGFYWFTADGHTNLCKPNKAYLCLTEEQTANFIFLIEEATAIRNIETAESANEVYTINGVKVKGDLQRGIYIINGKKTVVK